MTTLAEGHPIGFLYRREMKHMKYNWGPVLDRSIEKSKNMFRKNLYAHFGCVNAVEFSNDGQYLVSGGDDRRILLWNVGKHVIQTGEPVTMQAEHGSNVFALAISNGNSKLFSAGNDDQVILHDMETRVPLDTFLHEQPVYGITVDPYNDNIFSSACDDGRLLLYDTREPCSADPFCIASCRAAFHAVMFHPTEPRMVLSGNSKEGVALWDVRKPKRALLKYGGLNSDQCCMSARFNYNGSRILALRRRLPPVLYATNKTTHLYQFHHAGYYNSCTMKSCSFAGSRDQFILSGSDNFELYMWKIPEDNADLDSVFNEPLCNKGWVENANLILRGHRSIVNQVRYNHPYGIIVSSGVEKLIKVWSPFGLNSNKNCGDALNGMYEKKRRIFSNSEYLDLVTSTGQLMPLTYDNARRSTKEDPRMMAFFDALVQRDIEGLSSDNDTLEETNYTAISPPDSVETDRADEEPSGTSSVPNPNNGMLISDSGDATGVTRSRSEERVQEPDNGDDSDSIHSFGGDDFARMLHSTFQADSVPNSPRQSTRYEDPGDPDHQLKVPGDSEMASIVDPDANIIKELIAKKQARLRQMAKEHVQLESFPKIRQRKKRRQLRQLMSSTSSEDESEEVKRKRSRLQCPLEADNLHDSEDNEPSSSYQFPTPTSSESNASSKSDHERQKKMHQLSKLRYCDSKSRQTKSSGHECRATRTYKNGSDRISGASTSSETDDHIDYGSDEKRHKKHSKCRTKKKSTTSSSSSSATSSSDSDKDAVDRASPQPGCSSDLNPRLDSSSSPSSSSEDNLLSDTELKNYFERIKNSPSFKASPLIRKIEYARLRKLKRIQRRKRQKLKKHAEKSESSSSSSSSSSSEEEPLIPRNSLEPSSELSPRHSSAVETSPSPVSTAGERMNDVFPPSSSGQEEGTSYSPHAPHPDTSSDPTHTKNG